MNIDTEYLTLILPVIGKLLYTYPDKQLIENIKEAEILNNIPYRGISQSFQQGQKLLAEWQESNESYDAIISDFQDLFIGVNDKVKTPAWESIYVSSEPTMFGECTLDVRLWYDKYGMEIKNINHEPDDHMGIELMFLGILLQEDQKDAYEFFQGHIAKWYERFFTSMAANAKTRLYQGLALAAYGICSDLKEQAFLTV